MLNRIHYRSFLSFPLLSVSVSLSLSLFLVNNAHLSVAGWARSIRCSNSGPFHDTPKSHESIISCVLYGQEDFPSPWLSAVPPQSNPGKWYMQAVAAAGLAALSSTLFTCDWTNVFRNIKCTNCPLLGVAIFGDYVSESHAYVGMTFWFLDHMCYKMQSISPLTNIPLISFLWKVWYLGNTHSL